MHGSRAQGGYIWAMRHTLLLAMAASTLCVHSQDVRLLGGTLTIDPGTTLRLEEGSTWVIEPGAQLVNDGFIDLQTTAVLNEAPGWPVTGAGLEAAAPLAGATQPLNGHGGLGLRLDQAAPLPALTITRGHIPRNDPVNGDGIARWYALVGAAGLSSDAMATLSYDDTELGGLSETLLKLAKSSGENGPWAVLTSTASPALNQVSGTMETDAIHLTAFAVDPFQGLDEGSTEAALRVVPSLTSGPAAIHLGASSGRGLLRVLDARGREVARIPAHASDGMVTADFSHLAPGTYMVVAEDRGHALFVKQ